MAVRVSGEVKVVYSAEDKATPVGKQVQSGLRQTGGASDSVAEKMKRQWLSVANVLKVAVAAAVVAMAREVVRAFGQMLSSTVQVGNELDKFSKQSGLAVVELQKLKYAAEQEHLPFETLSKMFPLLSRYSKEAARGMETYKREFKAMGVEVVDNNGKMRNTYDIMLDMSEYMSNEAVPAHEKLAAAQTLLGRRGAEMIPFLKMGKEEIMRLGEEAVRVGGIISAESVAIAKAFDDQSTKAKYALQGIKEAFATSLMPYLYAFREWIIENLPLLRKEFANFGAGVGKAILMAVQVFIEWISWIKRLQVAWDVMVESASIGLRKMFQTMQWMNFIDKERAAMFRGLKERAEEGRKQAIQRQAEGLSEIDKWMRRSDEISWMMDNINKTKAEMIESAKSLYLNEVESGEAVEQTEKKKTAAVDKGAKERAQIYQWLADTEMELTYQGVELQKQKLVQEYMQRAMNFRLLGDHISALKTEVMLTAQLGKIDSEDEVKRRAEAKKQAMSDMKAAMDVAKDDLNQYLELLGREEEAYKEMVSLNAQLRDIRNGIYEDAWAMMMDSANLAGDEVGKFAGLAMTGIKGAWDTELGTDQYTVQMEQLTAFYQQRVEAIQAQYQIERELKIANNASELDIVLSHEEEKQRIRQAYQDRDLQMTGLQQAQKLDMYQNNVNFTMGILGMLASFADENSKIIFAIEKAQAIASIIINAHKAAAMGLAQGGPPLAAIYLAQGYALAAATAAMTIKQMATGTASPGGTLQGGAGYEYAEPEQPRWEEEKISRTINVYVYGNVVDHDKFARELIPSLDKAFEDNVH